MIQNEILKELKDRKTNDGRIIQGANHTAQILNHKLRKDIINRAIQVLSNYKFDSIACCGISGLMVVPTLCERLNKNIIIVRKENEKRYSPFDYEGAVPSNYIIVDDLICSGNTINRITKLLNEEIPSAKCVGYYSYLYSQCHYNKNPEYAQKVLGVKYLQ